MQIIIAENEKILAKDFLQAEIHGRENSLIVFFLLQEPAVIKTQNQQQEWQRAHNEGFV